MNVAFKGQAKASPLPPPRWSLGGWLHAPVLIKLPSAATKGSTYTSLFLLSFPRLGVADWTFVHIG